MTNKPQINSCYPPTVCADCLASNKVTLVVIVTKRGDVRSTNLNDNQIITPLTAFVSQQTACNLVGKSGRFLPLNRQFNY